MRKPKPEIKSLYYITHVENLPSILENGIFSHGLIEKRNIPFKPIYDTGIVSNRKDKATPAGLSLWDYANVYFQPRNPMLYRVVHEVGAQRLAIIGINPDILKSAGAFITDGNAANTPTEFFNFDIGIKNIESNWKVINSEWWNSTDGSKRKIMAECLVPNFIPPTKIHSIYVASHPIAEQVKSLVFPKALPIIPEPTMFFLPAKRYRIANNLYLSEGDMFFSNMHTLTVSVNTVGIMGKGLASRAKYQFPDVYVTYQDACRNKSLKMGKPFLYKREASLDEDLLEEPAPPSMRNSMKWFLLFATKNHWKDNSDFDGIEEGMRWLAKNYKSEGIQSIALPALGCGLGRLKWEDVGPMMCRNLVNLDIPVAVYLPREHEISDDFLSAGYLLSGK